MKRCIIIFVLMLLLFCAPVFASTLFGESTSEESWVLEHSSVNNDNKYWDVMLALSSDPPNKEYSAAADNELLRIRTNYGRTYTDDKYRKVTITPDNGSWVLTSDYNATVTRAYTFDLYEIAWTRSGSNQTAVANEDPTKITGTSSSTEYSFTMKAAEWETLGTDYAKKFYDYEIVLRLPELTQTERERLEPGDYHATFTVSLYTGSKGGSAVSYSYTIKAVYGETSGSNTAEYSFIIEEVNSTYNVDLSKTSQYFDVAGIKFHASGLSTENKRQSQIESAYSNKYKVLISPYPEYDMDDTSSVNPYMFVLNGTENLPSRTEINTVWYTLASSSNGSSLSLYDSSHYKHTYVITPSLSVSGTEKNWVLTWDLNKTIYIKPTAPTSAVTRAEGFYHTTLYFYVVTNT